jgi:hypothetical protein
MEETKGAPNELTADYAKKSTPDTRKTYGDAEDAKMLREGFHDNATGNKDAKREAEQGDKAKISLKERLSDALWNVGNSIAPDVEGAILLGMSGGIFGTIGGGAVVAIFALPVSGVIIGALAGVTIGAFVGGYWNR